MKLKFYLIHNPIAEDPKECRAQITNYESVTEKEIFDYITRKGSGITFGEVQANYIEIIEAHEFFLKQGYGINTEFIKARPSIQGVFKDANDSFDASRHRVKFNVRLGSRYDQVAADLDVEKTEPVNNAPVPAEFQDMNSGTVNGSVTPGGAAVISGIRLRFNPNDLAQGIYFITNGTTTKVSKIMDMRSTKLVFMVPGLAAGEYTIEIRKKLKGKEILKGVLPAKLEI